LATTPLAGDIAGKGVRSSTSFAAYRRLIAGSLETFGALAAELPGQLPYVRSMSNATASFRTRRLTEAQYIARAERFWRQLGMNPAGQQLFSPASPGASAPAQPAIAARPATPGKSATPAQPRPWLRMTRRRGYRNCGSSHSCMTRACFPTLPMRQPSDAFWNRSSSLSRRGRRHHGRLGRRSPEGS